MGTVGLSFGSPTSGTGFDVSTTVASIVSNLQNVETPWKTQLTSLESQDTAISSLGTLMSTLSNDLSQLTDFSGIMAQKTGSSSDTNVLELTAATSSAKAGTHTVVVNNLALTSSGYLAPVASASTTLTGSITLKVGTGTAQTITLGSTNNTLSGLASAINSSGVGITASVLTDSSGSRLSLVSGTSGANGNITISSNSIAAATSATLSYSGSAGTSTANSTGLLSAVAGVSDKLTGSISIQVGSGTAQTVSLGTSGGTLQDLADAINGTSGIGVEASVVTNSDGSSSLSLTSQTAGTAGTLTVSSSVTDPSTHLGYASTVTGKDASLTVDGVTLSSSSNTVANLIPGLTFQLLAPSSKESDGSLEQVQVVIGNDNSAVESTVNSFVSDYNSLISALNTQDGNDSSGNPEPLFGSPTLSLLQQQLLSGLNLQNPNGSLDSISSNTDTTLAGSMTIAVAGGFTLNYSGTDGSDTVTSTGTLSSIANASDTLTGSISIQVGSGTAQTVTLDSSDNTLDGLKKAINDADIGVTASVVTNSDGSSSLSLLSGTSGADGTLTVTSSIKDTSAQTIDVPTTSGDNTLAGLASAINTANIGVTASIVTTGTQSTLSLLSHTSGSSGALTVTSKIAATSDALLGATTYTGSSTLASSSTIGSTSSTSNTLDGSITIQVGTGTAQTITLDSSNNTLTGLKDAINSANLGVTASIVTNSDNTYSLSLESGTTGTAGNLTVTSNILDTANPSTVNLSYTSSSDLSGLASLGITVSSSADGTLSFDATTLDSALNSDFSGVLGFFQGGSSWGVTFSNVLENAGSSSSTGILSLAKTANSSTESTLNADISKEESTISAEQKSLTAELNSANEIMQELPSELDSVNELYSAITGYNQSK